MAIYRAPRPKNHYTQIRNDVLRDDRLSYRARGILAVILSQPDDWTTTAEALARAGREGRDAIQAAFRELKDAGYMVQVKRQDRRGRWTTQTIVYDTPEEARAAEKAAQGTLFDSPEQDSQAPVPSPDFPSSVQPSSVDQALIEQLPKNTPGSANRPDADLVATFVYEAMDKMGNYMAIRQVAAKALRAGHPVPTVRAVMAGLVQDGRPLTGQTVYTALNGSQGATMGQVNAKWDTPGASFGKEVRP